MVPSQTNTVIGGERRRTPGTLLDGAPSYPAVRPLTLGEDAQKCPKRRQFVGELQESALD
jgi:hypothetical protein